MQITKQIKIDMANRHLTEPVYAVQGDSNTRVIVAKLFENNIPWEVPQNVTAAVAFSKPDGTKGLYDQLPDKTNAVTIDSNIATAILAPEVLTCDGVVSVSIVFYNEKMEPLSTFPFTVVVEKNPAAGEQLSNNYYALQNMEQVNTAYNELLTRLEVLEMGGTKNIFAASVDALSEWNSGVIVSRDNSKVVFTASTTGDRGVKASVSGVNVKKQLHVEFHAENNTTIVMAYVFIFTAGNEYVTEAAFVNGNNRFDLDVSQNNGSTSFDVIIAANFKDNNLGETFTVSNFRVWQDKEDVTEQVEENAEKIKAIQETKADVFIVAPDGSRYLHQVSSTGTLSAIPVVPSKAFFLGNSLLVGFGFGMAASDNQHDYYYLVNQAILSTKSNYVSSKLAGWDWEACTTTDAQNDFMQNTLLPNLSDDVELAIVQLGDNVNTDEKLSVFEQGARNLLQFIRMNCPRARVAWVGEWYGTATRQEYIRSACEKTGCTFIDISDLKTTANQSAIGNTYTKEDGTIETITDAGVASHPGDAGFKAIANRVLYALGIADTERYYS